MSHHEGKWGHLHRVTKLPLTLDELKPVAFLVHRFLCENKISWSLSGGQYSMQPAIPALFMLGGPLHNEFDKVGIPVRLLLLTEGEYKGKLQTPALLDLSFRLCVGLTVTAIRYQEEELRSLARGPKLQYLEVVLDCQNIMEREGHYERPVQSTIQLPSCMVRAAAFRFVIRWMRMVDKEPHLAKVDPRPKRRGATVGRTPQGYWRSVVEKIGFVTLPLRNDRVVRVYLPLPKPDLQRRPQFIKTLQEASKMDDPKNHFGDYNISALMINTKIDGCHAAQLVKKLDKHQKGQSIRC